MNNIFVLFISFLKIGLFTFGGGYAMIPLIHDEIVKKHKFISEEEVLDIFAIAEVTPGPIAINSATFIGYKLAGFMGSLLATIGVVLPSIIIIILIWFFLAQFTNNEILEYAFSGIKIGVVVLIFNAGLKLNKANKLNVFNFIMIILTFLLISFTNISIILVLIFGIISGIVYNIYFNKDFKEGDR